MGKPAPKGNNYKMKWKTSEERKVIHKKLCSHLREGLSWGCFPPAEKQTVYRYMKDFPTDFVADEIAAAEKEGILGLERAGVEASKGKRKIDSNSWKFIMMNRAGWSLSSKEDITSNGKDISYGWGKPDSPNKKDNDNKGK